MGSTGVDSCPTEEDSKSSSGSNDYVNIYLQPFLAYGQQYTHDEFVELLASTLEVIVALESVIVALESEVVRYGLNRLFSCLELGLGVKIVLFQAFVAFRLTECDGEGK
ncbi:hypothetical protein CCACVL1_07987 [Corchorus capsularis]|uniref:Uncharacterized protein n=1 Tax=Corchorus capsularis TaxID=210143 RepID=A0A1R3J333_COCAP|nr:hypothetical protein CCACVL1_07987 [Corchorus capsularis]